MDEATFRALADRQLADVWRFARRRCHTAEDADDVASETFAVAWRRRDDLPVGDDARLWLYGVARKVIANQRRSTSRLHRLREKVGASIVVAPHVADPADVAVARSDGALRRALATLSEADRELLLMRAWDGLAVTDIAALLDISPNAASVRLTKARNKLAAALAPRDSTSNSKIEAATPILDQKDPGVVRTPIDQPPTAEGGTR